ncbi:hypothetical protein CONLIGDRAFT_626976 [Coniochaeta ligniaria NRRL 30616]|uniref:Uncharacterized protein n=1 Tax=Coniochaeta ligniaria NRRL 30616 TaxID=1408157 RepID=A0A1J7J625_9PEZI|nr:hypothetical protein CONLIGDRAFT_626976 [Coniochaeta ligniaria NRRL 30616]
MANLFPAVAPTQTSLIIGCGRNTVADYVCKPGPPGRQHRLAGFNQYQHLCPPNINMVELWPAPDGDYQDGGVRAQFCYTITEDARANAHIQDTFLSATVAAFAAQQPLFDLVYWDHAGNLFRPTGLDFSTNNADQAVNSAWGMVRPGAGGQPGGLLVLSCVGFEERCTAAAGAHGNPPAQWQIVEVNDEKTTARAYLNGLPAQLGVPAANAHSIWTKVKDATGEVKAANDAAAVGDVRVVDGIAVRKQ